MIGTRLRPAFVRLALELERRPAGHVPAHGCDAEGVLLERAHVRDGEPDVRAVIKVAQRGGLCANANIKRRTFPQGNAGKIAWIMWPWKGQSMAEICTISQVLQLLCQERREHSRHLHQTSDLQPSSQMAMRRAQERSGPCAAHGSPPGWARGRW